VAVIATVPVCASMPWMWKFALVPPAAMTTGMEPAPTSVAAADRRNRAGSALASVTVTPPAGAAAPSVTANEP
jgi:hypothetical protein